MKTRFSIFIFIASLAAEAPAIAAVGGRTTATVYAGRHFEVRDHDEPVKYVFNGDTRVARITGSLATTPRIQRLRLYSGWNLVSLAVSATDVLHQFTNSQISSSYFQSMFCWEPSKFSWSPLLPAQAIPAGTVLWVQATTNAVVPLVGDFTYPTSRMLNAGGVFLPSAGLKAWDFQSAISNLASATAWTYDAHLAHWDSWLGPSLQARADMPAVIAPGSAVFIRSATPAELELPESAASLRYYHSDHLGSSSAITGTDGTLMDEKTYYPFGIVRNDLQPRRLGEPYQFTQKERDAESGLHYFEARYLGSRLPRFVSPDPKFANPDLLEKEELAGRLGNPQEPGGYTYVGNRPMTLTDPTGLESWWDEMMTRSGQQAAPSPFSTAPTAQTATFYDKPKRTLSKTAVWRASLSAVCQKEPGKEDYRVLDTISYGFAIDASGNVQASNPVGGANIKVKSFSPYTKGGYGGVIITADYTGSCEYTLQWVQTIMTSSPKKGCGFIYNDPCKSDDPPGKYLPFYYTEREIVNRVKENARGPNSALHDAGRSLRAQSN